MNNVSLNGQVVANKFGGIRAVCVNTPNFSSGQENILRSLIRKKALNRRLICKIKLGVGPLYDVFITAQAQSTNDRTTCKSAVACYVYF